MAICEKLIVIFILSVLIPISVQENVTDTENRLDAKLNITSNTDVSLTKDKLQAHEDKKVDIKVYYESLCPASQEFVTEELAPTVKELTKYLDINLYPYGNAETIIEDNGNYKIECQHGPEECYGNKLHACSIDQLHNITKAVMYIACMMNSSQINEDDDADVAADKCATNFKINSEPIKQCAKSNKGNELLKYYGDESEKVNVPYVPYVFINGDLYSSGDNFMTDVCAIFKIPPPPCSNLDSE